MTKEQAIEDFKWLRFALEYIHPRLYKYDDKKTVDARFDSLSKQISGEITGLDFLALLSRANAAVRCGHLYTIPQGQLANEIMEKKVLPFHIKILENKIYILNDCSRYSIPDGSQILMINGKCDKEILDAIIPGIASDGYIQTRKLRLMERYFFYLFHGCAMVRMDGDCTLLLIIFDFVSLQNLKEGFKKCLQLVTLINNLK